MTSLDEEFKPKTKWSVALRSLPNQLTLARVLSVPFLLLVYPLDFVATNFICSIIFGLAALTDFFDGFIARRTNQVTRIGQLLDPIADKILSAGGLLLIASMGRIPVFLAGFMLLRDIAISGVRMVALENGRSIPVSSLGKWKTVFQYFGIGFLMVNRNWFEIPFRASGMLSIWIALLLSYYSGYLYVKAYLEDMEK